MFRDAKKGDRVWYLYTREWGTVVDIVQDDTYPLRVAIDNDNTTPYKSFTYGGISAIPYITPALFWDELPEIVPPKKPLPTLKVDTKVLVWEMGSEYEKLKRYFSHFDKDTGRIYVFVVGNTSWSVNDKNKDVVSWSEWELYVEDVQ